MTEMNREYGTALFMLAKELGAENEYALALECVEEVFDCNPQYLDFLSSPNITINERLSALETAFKDSVPQNVLSFVQLLCEKGRINSLKGSVEEYKKLLNAQNRVSTAIVTSAIELTDTEKEKLQHKLEIKTGHSVILECRVDSSIMGGMLIEIDGKIIDASLKNYLHDVKDVIS